MDIVGIKRFLNKNKELTLDEILATKIFCKGFIGTTFTVKDKNGVFEDYSVTLNSGSKQLKGDEEGRVYEIVSVPSGEYVVEVKVGEELGDKIEVDLGSLSAGQTKVVEYVITKILQTFESSGEFNIPEGMDFLAISAIAGGGDGGIGGVSPYHSTIGGAGGGGGGRGESIVNRTFNVKGKTKLVITINGKSGKTGGTVVIDDLITLAGGTPGGNATTPTEYVTQPGTGGTYEGKDGGKNPEDPYRQPGSGGDAGAGMKADGTMNTVGAKGGNGNLVTSSSSAKQNGKNATDYGGGGGGGAGAYSDASNRGSGGLGKKGVVIILKKHSDK